MNSPVVIGWRERVDFLDWGIRGARVKIDTGARTAAIDAIIHDVKLRADGKSTIVLGVGRRPAGKIKIVEAPLLGTTRVRSTFGESAERYLIETTIRLGTGYEEDSSVDRRPLPNAGACHPRSQCLGR